MWCFGVGAVLLAWYLSRDLVARRYSGLDHCDGTSTSRREPACLFWSYDLRRGFCCFLSLWAATVQEPEWPGGMSQSSRASGLKWAVEHLTWGFSFVHLVY